MLNKRYLLILATLAASFVSCDNPEKAGSNIGAIETNAKEVSIRHLLSFYKGHPFTFAENIKISGYVISNDENNNLTNTLILQDETDVIEIKIKKEKLYLSFYPGTLVEISCNDLTLGKVSEVLQLGVATPDSKFETGFIPTEIFDSKIQIKGESGYMIMPENIRFTDLSDDFLSHYIAIDGVMFEEYGIKWCDEDPNKPADPDKPESFLDTERAVINRDRNRLIVRTSGDAEFAGSWLPKGSGSIEGILSKSKGEYRLKVINHNVLYNRMSSPRFDEKQPDSD